MNKGKYLSFIELPPKAKTKVFEVRNTLSGNHLGYVKWYAQWRKYCFFTDFTSLVFDAGCLSDIQDFITNLMLERRKKDGRSDT